jgi:hypothetical protein
MNRFSRLTPAVLTLALLSATPALPQTHRGAAPRTTPVSEALRGFLPDFLVRLWSDEGCGLDPFGRCRPEGTPAAQPGLTSVRAEEGCSIDPYGRCLH